MNEILGFTSEEELADWVRSVGAAVEAAWLGIESDPSGGLTVHISLHGSPTAGEAGEASAGAAVFRRFSDLVEDTSPAGIGRWWSEAKEAWTTRFYRISAEIGGGVIGGAMGRERLVRTQVQLFPGTWVVSECTFDDLKRLFGVMTLSEMTQEFAAFGVSVRKKRYTMSERRVSAEQRILVTQELLDLGWRPPPDENEVDGDPAIQQSLLGSDDDA